SCRTTRRNERRALPRLRRSAGRAPARPVDALLGSDRAGRRHYPGRRAPVLAAAATTLVLGLVFLLVGPRTVPADPAERLVRSVVAEHTRALMWGARRPGGPP